MIEIMKKTLLTICVLLLASWSAAVAQVNPAKVHKVGDRATLTLSTEFNQLQVKDKGVKADSEEETWEAYAVGTYIHGATNYVHLDRFNHTFENMLGANLPAAKYESTLYRSSKNFNKYKISPWANNSEMVFSVDNITGLITVKQSPVGLAGQAGNIFAIDSYGYCGEHPSTYDVANGVFTFFIALLDNQYIYGVDNDQFVITEKYVVSGGTCGKNGGDNVIWQLDQTGELLIHGSGEMEDYMADENTIGRRPWKDLGGLISSIRIAKGVTNVGEGAFAFFEGATSIKISNSVTSIGTAAFYGCSGLTSIEIPNSVTSIGRSAFANCSGLTSIEIPNSVTSIGTSAMNRCSSLKNIFIPNSVESIGTAAFYGCSGLTSIEIPNSVTSIGEGAFGGCGLTCIVVATDNSVYDSRENCNAIIETVNNTLVQGCKETFIPNSVTSIGTSAFEGCSDLTSIVIPNSVTSIGDYAVNRCSSLKNIFIPHSVESIGKYAFYGCSELQSVVMGNSVESIGRSAFGGCGLTSIVVATKNPVYDSREDCNAIVETATNTLIAGCKETFIPNSVTSIGESAFYDCSGLISIEIPNSVTSIGASAFEDCSDLTSLEIPNSVTSIGDYAFYGCSGLSRLVLPNSITSIGKAVVYGCSNLTNLVIPNSVTSIGDYAVNRCSSLKNIFIPHSVESIGTYAFYGCSELQSVVMGNSVTAIGEGGFGGCDKLDTIKMLGEIPPTAFDNTFSNYDATLYVPIGSAGIYRSADVWTNFSLIEEFDATGIENVETIVGKNVSVYTTNGKLVQQIPNYNGEPLRLPKGVYVVRAGKETKKVLVK